MRTEIFLTIIGMALVTYLPRMIPLVVLHRLPLPGAVYRWLGYVPVAVMAALLGPALAMPQGELQLTWTNKFILAALPTFLLAVKTRSLVATVIAGILAAALLNICL
ncbi:MAG: AzlD domain-containing protein [Armatimonadetes bacterium]|nr:AzlD domain-containing protein [Armatimonadota bacterium]